MNSVAQEVKRINKLVVATMFALGMAQVATVSFGADVVPHSSKEPSAEKSEATAAPKSRKTVRHFVAFKFADTATPEQVRIIDDGFRNLKTIPGIVSIEQGSDISTEKLNKGFTHAYLVTFNSDKDRDTYLIHPDHEKFKKILKPAVVDVFVMDFWGK